MRLFCLALLSLGIIHGFKLNQFSRSPSWKHRKLHSFPKEYDVTVVGGGPAGTAIANLLQTQQNLKVVLVDPRINEETTWYPNYGEWRDEWELLSKKLSMPELRECTTNEWETTDCYFGGNENVPIDQNLAIDRAYIRVDRKKLQQVLKSNYLHHNGTIIHSKLLIPITPDNLSSSIVHDRDSTTLMLENGDEIKSRIVIDATGFESKLTNREHPVMNGRQKVLPIGYQIAYGFIATVDRLGPYDPTRMTLFDYRTDHIEATGNQTWIEDACSRPTFMYVMPLTHNTSSQQHRVFFEETSLIGQGNRRISFAECQARAKARLAYHNITIQHIEEEEYCYIPMGGELPNCSQRILAFGAAGSLVHPSTGYQLCRMLFAAQDIANVLGVALTSPSSSTRSSQQIVSQCYQTMWNTANRRQRDFHVFGAYFFMKQSIQLLRSFFTTFFQITPQQKWAGFLAGWVGLPGNAQYHAHWWQRLSFASEVFLKFSWPIQWAVLREAIQYMQEYSPFTLLRTFLPEPIIQCWEKNYHQHSACCCGDNSNNAEKNCKNDANLLIEHQRGDVEAKQEAKQLMAAFYHTRHMDDTDDQFVFPAPFDQK